MYLANHRLLREVFNGSRTPQQPTTSKLIAFRNGVRQLSSQRTEPVATNAALTRALKLQQSQIENLQSELRTAQPSAAEMRRRKLAQAQAEINRDLARARHAR